MSKHTPAPWVVNDFCTQDSADVAVWTSHDPHTGKSICECHFNTMREIERGETGCHQLEAEANARLISAAPDAFTAAEIAIIELQAVEREIGVVSKALPLLRAFVAKVNGEQL